MFGEKQETLSYEHRFGDLEIGLNQSLQHPILGKGIGDESFQKVFLERFNLERKNSNGWMRLIMATGALGTILYLISCFKLNKWFQNHGFPEANLVVFIWLIFSLTNEPIESCAFVMFLIGIGWHADPNDDLDEVFYDPELIFSIGSNNS